MAFSNPIAALPTPSWFSEMARNYSRQTGNTTLNLFHQILQSHIQTSSTPITTSSIIHDNAAGPGTATCVLKEKFADGFPSKILISDNNAAMVKGAADTFEGTPGVSCQELDSQNLSAVSDEEFTHSIMNFSMFNIADADSAIKEIHRTLKPGGLAMISTWKRFGAGETVGAAQALVRPDLPSIPICGPEWFKEGVLEGKLAEGGFSRDNMKSAREEIIVGEGEELEGLKGLFLGPMMKRAREGWTDDEEARWPEVIDKAVKGEIENFGGIKFEAWVVLVTK